MWWCIAPIAREWLLDLEAGEPACEPEASHEMPPRAPAHVHFIHTHSGSEAGKKKLLTLEKKMPEVSRLFATLIDEVALSLLSS